MSRAHEPVMVRGRCLLEINADFWKGSCTTGCRRRRVSRVV
jgi:hypothetical protein